MEVWVVCLISLRDFGIEKGEREIKRRFIKIVKNEEERQKEKG